MVMEGLSFIMLAPMVERIFTQEESGVENQDLIFNIQEYVTFLPESYSVYYLMAIIVVLIILKSIFYFSALMYTNVLAMKLMTNIRKELLTSALNMEYELYCKQNLGHLTNIINQQVTRVIQVFRAMSMFISNVVLVVISLIFVSLVSIELVVIALILGLVYMKLTQNISMYAKKMSTNTAIESGRLNSMLIQSINSYEYVSATNMSSKILKITDKIISNIRHYEFKNGIVTSSLLAVREPFIIIIFLTMIVVQLESKIIDPTLIIAGLFLFYRAINSLFSMQAAWHGVVELSSSVDLIVSELAKFSDKPREHNYNFIKGLKGIQLKNVSYSYNGLKPYNINNINIEIESGEAVAFVGRSGSGKSTILKLIAHIITPTSGDIFYGTPGKGEKSMMVSDVGFISQEISLFEGTILENITLWSEDIGNKDLFMSRVIDAARFASAHDFIKQLDDGYDTVIGELGAGLSLGQRQRIALARELYRRPKILFLDEATSALDIESEQAIGEALLKLKGKVTIIAVAHRLNSLKYFDKIHVLDNGRVLESGKYADMVADTKSKFSMMLKKYLNKGL